MGQTWYSCLNCNCGYSQYTDLHEHIRAFSDCSSYYVHHQRPLAPAVVHCQKEEESWHCNRCGYDFSSQAVAANHIRGSETCRRHYIQTYGRDAYLWTVNHLESEVYECGSCDKKFATLQGLHRHTLTRSYCRRVTPHCKSCKWDFGSQAVFIEHLRTEDKCRVRYIREHGRTYYDTVIVDLTPTDVTLCDYCSCEFSTYQELGQHFRTHTSCRDKHNFDQRVDQMKKEKMKKTKIKPGTEPSITLHSTDTAALVLRKVSQIIKNPELMPDEKLTRQQLMNAMVKWANGFDADVESYVRIVPPAKEPQIKLLVSYDSSNLQHSWDIEIVGTGVHIKNIPSLEARDAMVEQIKAHPEQWMPTR